MGKPSTNSICGRVYGRSISSMRRHVRGPFWDGFSTPQAEVDILSRNLSGTLPWSHSLQGFLEPFPLSADQSFGAAAFVSRRASPFSSDEGSPFAAAGHGVFAAHRPGRRVDLQGWAGGVWPCVLCLV